MRLVLTLILALLLSSCDVHFLTEFDGRYDEGTFEKEMIVDNIDVDDGKLDILVFSDAHIGREINDTGVTEYNDELVAELKKGYDLVLSVGDLSDEGDMGDPNMLGFLNAIVAEAPFIGAIGNHELHAGKDAPYWAELYKEHGVHGPVGAYGIGEEVTVYALDSSWRIFSKDQLDALESAMDKDDAAFKIVLSHTDLTSGDGFNQSGIFILGEAQIAERNRLYRILSEDGPSILFTGHRHYGSGAMQHNDRLWEYNLDALHARDVALQSDGVFYRVQLYLETLTVTVQEVLAADLSVRKTVEMDY